MTARRGSNAVEFALLLPVLMLVLAGIIDLGQYLIVADALTHAVSDGARVALLADPDDGDDPLDLAQTVAARDYDASGLGGVSRFEAAYAGIAAPDERLIVTGIVEFEPWFGFVPLPDEVEYRSVVRLVYQP